MSDLLTMKQFKLNSKTPPKTSAPPSTTTQQEVDALARELSERISKNPKKAARIFEVWLNGKPKSQTKKRAA